MADGFEPAVFVHGQAKGVAQLFAAVENAGSEELIDERRAADFRLIKVLIPQKQVFHSSLDGHGAERCRSNLSLRRDRDAPGTF